MENNKKTNKEIIDLFKEYELNVLSYCKGDKKLLKDAGDKIVFLNPFLCRIHSILLDYNGDLNEVMDVTKHVKKTVKNRGFILDEYEIVKQRAPGKGEYESSLSHLNTLRQDIFKKADDFIRKDDEYYKYLDYDTPHDWIRDFHSKYNSYKEEITGAILKKFKDYPLDDTLKTGYLGLDNFIEIGEEAPIILLAGETNDGKTIVQISVALHNAIQGKRILFFSHEVSKKEMTRRFLKLYFNGGLKELQSRECIDTYEKMVDYLEDKLLYVPLPNHGYKWTKVKAIIEEENAKGKLDAVFIDGVQGVSFNDGVIGGTKELNNMMSDINEMKQRHKIPFVLTAQAKVDFTENRTDDNSFEMSESNTRWSKTLSHPVDWMITLNRMPDRPITDLRNSSTDIIYYFKIVKSRLGQKETGAYFKLNYSAHSHECIDRVDRRELNTCVNKVRDLFKDYFNTKLEDDVNAEVIVDDCKVQDTTIREEDITNTFHDIRRNKRYENLIESKRQSINACVNALVDNSKEHGSIIKVKPEDIIKKAISIRYSVEFSEYEPVDYYHLLRKYGEAVSRGSYKDGTYNPNHLYSIRKYAKKGYMGFRAEYIMAIYHLITPVMNKFGLFTRDQHYYDTYIRINHMRIGDGEPHVNPFLFEMYLRCLYEKLAKDNNTVYIKEGVECRMDKEGMTDLEALAKENINDFILKNGIYIRR